jgi:monovalent cation:H+ antiporter, CPA1 family
MNLFNIIAVIITLSALFSFINYRYIKLPSVIGLMVISLFVSLGIIALNLVGFDLRVASLMHEIDFNQTLMVGMLSYLLFAGALHVNIDDLFENKLEIGLFATLGVILSTIIVGGLIFFTFQSIGQPIQLIYCLLFGALISPTDPIAVLGILKKAGAPKSLEIKIAGESLFNDGIGMVVFLVIFDIAFSQGVVDPIHIAYMFIGEVFGGVLLGLVLGYLSYMALKQVDQYQVEILITLALVTGGYALALVLHVSGPIVVVIAGLLIGNQGRQLAMTFKTRQHLDSFWELIDEILNSVLFVLIGFELLIVSFSANYLFLGIIAILIVIFARFVAIFIPMSIINIFKTPTPGAITVLTWGGLRGGISIALALSLPKFEFRDEIISITYIIVVFSIIVQGLTIGKVVKATSRARRIKRKSFR